MHAILSEGVYDSVVHMILSSHIRLVGGVSDNTAACRQQQNILILLQGVSLLRSLTPCVHFSGHCNLNYESQVGFFNKP